ncbi:Metallo-dependent phosphatase-like protein [Scheffersomyces coipomensis]|uniref:Metallo-dependent phosphatase-like protein n=1 Tax=Scheffersomyces coipomensis TaxID=1788519 RepID=UPI00315C7130
MSSESNKELAIQYKDEGNAFLKEHKYEEAIASYTKAIEEDPTNAIFYSNRAQAHIKLENYGSAILNCNEALLIDADLVKAYYRKGVSLMAILRHKDALANFKIVLNKMPNDKLTLENYKQCTNYLKKLAFEKAISTDGNTLVINTINYDGAVTEKSWEGPSLKINATKATENTDVQLQIEGLDIDYLKYMIKLFKDGGRLPKLHVFAIIAKVHELFRKESTMVEISLPHTKLDVSNSTDEIILENGKTLTIVGDTHGQFYDVLNLFQKFGYVSPDHIYLFNGDFVDRGSWSCEVALYFYVLKIIFPTSVYINRGNHETIDMNRTYGFTDECEHKYSKKIFDAFTESFAALPLSTLINGSYLCMHGGLFSDDKITLQDIKAYNRFPSSGSTQPPKQGIAMELLWTDPQEVNGRGPSKRGIGMQFGPDITERFCLSNKIRKVIRSHEVRMEGYEEEHNGRLITVFSAPNYCDQSGNLGAVIHITENEAYNKDNDNGEGYRDVNDPNCPWNLKFEKFAAVPHPDIKPMAYSKGGFGF